MSGQVKTPGNESVETPPSPSPPPTPKPPVPKK
jgi:hypothetical protein